MTAKQILPVQIIGKADIARLRIELEKVEEHMHQLSLRKKGEVVDLPKMSQQLEELAETLGLNMLHSDERQKLMSMIRQIAKRAPQVHLSFATTPSPIVMQKIADWFRHEIHPLMLLKVGLQPSIAAGCIIRTSNKQFDFSLRHLLTAKQDLLVNAVKGKYEW